jgi:hypothetical protein
MQSIDHIIHGPQLARSIGIVGGEQGLSAPQHDFNLIGDAQRLAGSAAQRHVGRAQRILINFF